MRRSVTLLKIGTGTPPRQSHLSTRDEVGEVKAKLLEGQFTTQELQLLRAVIDLKLGKMRSEVKIEVEEVSTDHFVSILYTAFSELVLQRQGQRVPHLGMLKRMNPRFFKEVIDAARGLKEFLDEVIPRCSRPQQVAFVRMFIDLAYSRCQIEGGLVTTSRLMKRHTDVGALIEEAFPGYVSARMLPVVLSGFPQK